MLDYEIIAIEKLHIDPDTANIVFSVAFSAMAIMVITAIIHIAWQGIPILIDNRRLVKAEESKKRNSIRFDSKESILYCGYNQTRIEPESFEFYVCEVTFKAPSKYHYDEYVQDIKNNYTNTSGSIRSVEQAVRRLNKKGQELGLEDDLFKRSKERTSVSDKYRSWIIQS